MKVSEITISELTGYLRLEETDLSAADIQLLDTLLNVALAYVKSYTGLVDAAITGEEIGVGDGVETTFTAIAPAVYTPIVYIDGVATTDFTRDEISGEVTLDSAPALNASITMDYVSKPSNLYDDLVIAVYVLVQDMFDNRTLYVDKTNMNKVVEAILGMHKVNLL